MTKDWDNPRRAPGAIKVEWPPVCDNLPPQAPKTWPNDFGEPLPPQAPTLTTNNTGGFTISPGWNDPPKWTGINDWKPTYIANTFAEIVDNYRADTLTWHISGYNAHDNQGEEKWEASWEHVFGVFLSWMQKWPEIIVRRKHDQTPVINYKQYGSKC